MKIAIKRVQSSNLFGTLPSVSNLRKAKKIQSFLFLFVLLSAFFAGCKENTPLDDEQYIKQVYIVGADETTNMGMSVVDIPYSDTEQETSISVAAGGSLNIDRDITVTIEEAGTDAIDDYNFKYLEEDDTQYQKLENSHYRIPDYDVRINTGNVYGTMPVYIAPSGLSCDSLYALTFRIKSISHPDYISIREKDTVLILTFSFVNDYSGSCQTSGYYYQWIDGAASGDSVSLSLTRELKAVNANTVRFYHLSSTESPANTDAYGVTLTVAADNSVMVNAWGSLEITDGGGTYNPGTKTFTIWYNYMSGGTEYQVSATYTGETDG